MRALVIEKKVQNLNRLTTCSSYINSEAVWMQQVLVISCLCVCVRGACTTVYYGYPAQPLGECPVGWLLLTIPCPCRNMCDDMMRDEQISYY